MTTPPTLKTLPELPEPVTTWYGSFSSDRVKFHSTDQIYEFAAARVKTALAAQPPAVAAIPEGWAVKPLEPTKEMLESVGSILEPYPAKLVWMRMNLAAPPPPAGQQDRGIPLTLTEALNFFTKDERMTLWKEFNFSDAQIATLTKIVLSKQRANGIGIAPATAGEATAAQGAGKAPKANMFHDAGAIAQCAYCRRYTLDLRALSARQPTCTCGKTDGWSGSFLWPQSDSLWHGERPGAPEGGQ